MLIRRLVTRVWTTNSRGLRGKASDLMSMIQNCSVAGNLPTTEKSLKNPYEPEKKKCILCRHNVELDYKNPRLLSQFLSSFSGRLYEKNVLGLCEHQYVRLRKAIALSRKAGFLPVFTKEPRYLKDPRLFDPMRPIRPNPY